jgi:concanavalin A-like lectin/glucanase superfamily protein
MPSSRRSGGSRGRSTALTTALTVAATLVVLALQIPSASAATTVATWNMGDSGSTMSDASGRGHPGTLHGVTVKQAGISGSAFGFTRKPAYVTVPASADFAPGTGPFQLTVYLRTSVLPSASVEDYDIIRMGLSTTSGGDWKLEVLKNGVAYCGFRGSGGVASATSGRSVVDGAWHTVSCRRSATAVSVTVDGTATTLTGNRGSITSQATLYIGAKDTAGDDQYTGLVDSVTLTRG